MVRPEKTKIYMLRANIIFNIERVFTMKLASVFVILASHFVRFWWALWAVRIRPIIIFHHIMRVDFLSTVLAVLSI
jgi:hypothetical protein